MVNGNYVIDGARCNLASAFELAKQHGFNGSKQTIYRRLIGGASTWEEVARPIAAEVHRKISAGGVRRWSRAHEEMAAVIAAMDARKAALK